MYIISRHTYAYVYSLYIIANFSIKVTLLQIRVSSETSFVSYFAKHETKQVSCFAKQTGCFAKFRLEAKQAVSHVSLFCKRNETACFACFVKYFFQILSFIKKIVDVGPQIVPKITSNLRSSLGLKPNIFLSLKVVMMVINRIHFRCRFRKSQVTLVTKCT
jgi:hypothetical protein